MRSSSPTRPLSSASIVTTKNVRTECELDGLPRRSICHSVWPGNPTHSKALKLIAAEAALRPRRQKRRESVRVLRQQPSMAKKLANEYALHAEGELREERR